MLKYERFREALRTDITQSGLDVGAVYFILKDIVREVEPLYLRKVQEDLKKEKETEEEQE